MSTRCTSKSSDSSKFSAFSFEAILDIPVIYSHVPFSFRFIETMLAKNVLVFAFSFFAKYFSIFSRKFLAFSSSDIASLNAFKMLHFIIIRLMQLELSHLSCSFLSQVTLGGERYGVLFPQRKVKIHAVENNKKVLFPGLEVCTVKRMNEINVGGYSRSRSCN